MTPAPDPCLALADVSAPAERRLTRLLAILALFMGMRMFAGSYSVGYLAEHGLTLAQVGALKSLQMLLILGLDVPTSFLADRFGRRNAILLSIACAAVWLGLTGIGRSFAWFAAGECFNAVSLAINSGVGISYAVGFSRSLPNAPPIKDVIARAGQLQALCMAASALAGTFCSDTAARWPWLAASAGCAIIGVAAIVFFPDDIQSRPPVPETGVPLRAVPARFAKDLLRNGLVVPVLWSVYLAVVGQVFIQFWQVGLMDRTGAVQSARVFGVAFTVILLAQYAASRLAGVSNGGLSRVSAAAALLCAGLVLFARGGMGAPAVVCALAFGAFGIKFLSIEIQSRLHGAFPEALRSTYDSLVSTLGRIVLVPGLLAAGAATGRLGIAFVGALVASLAACLAARTCKNLFARLTRRGPCP